MFSSLKFPQSCEIGIAWRMMAQWLEGHADLPSHTAPSSVIVIPVLLLGGRLPKSEGLAAPGRAGDSSHSLLLLGSVPQRNA